jgi:large repetitive protein
MSRVGNRTNARIAAIAGLVALLFATALPTNAFAAMTVSKASLSAGSLRVEGQGASPNATITVASLESTATGKADSKGAYKVSASGFISSTCNVTVRGGTVSVNATLTGCTPVPVPTTATLTSLSLSHLSLDKVGNLAVGEVALAALATTPVTVALTSSNPGVAPVDRASVVVAAGAQTATFLVTYVSAVTTATTVTFSASAGAVTKTTTIIINPPAAFAFPPITEVGPGFVGADFATTATSGTTVGVTGRVGIIDFAIIAGQLPAGLSLTDPNNGGTLQKIPAIAISGVPTTVQTSTFTLRATDRANGNQATIALTIRVNPALGLTISPQLPWSPVVGNFTNLWITGDGGVVPYTWVRTAGVLPPGMSLVQDVRDGPLVRVTGTPTTAGTYTFTLKLTDAQGTTVSQSITATVA